MIEEVKARPESTATLAMNQVNTILLKPIMAEEVNYLAPSIDVPQRL